MAPGAAVRNTEYAVRGTRYGGEISSGDYPVPPAERTGPLWDALREVMDPEIPISLVDMGLIYDVRLEDGTAHVDLTYTAIGCPCTGFIRYDIAERLGREDGVEDVAIHEVWNPPWNKSRISEAGKHGMRAMGVSV
jgi:metal-sulfur cluster biosynthetic enzyme